jgi:hypothetical protein
MPSAPARALREVLFDVVAELAPQQPGIHIPGAGSTLPADA